MSSNGNGDIAISVRGLSKSYTIAHDAEKHTTLAEAALAWVKQPFRRASKETFWALSDVSFDVSRGDVVGIIGRNGAGKSTLLKTLSRITEPTLGEIDLCGRVGSLLEVGTGFHHELTGRENIYLNGAILGMSRREITKQFDAIVEFAEVEKFLDTPVKRYSSGMYVRLAFAVAAHLTSEILMVDEVLAVGDAEFQRKCLSKIKQLALDGRTILFVSHNMKTVQELCSRALILDRGRTAFLGEVEEAVGHYFGASAQRSEVSGNSSPHGLELCKAALRQRASGQETNSPVLDDDYELVMEFEAHRPLEQCGFVASVRDENGTLISTMSSLEEGFGLASLHGRNTVIFNLPRLQLLPGRYSVDICVRKRYTSIRYLDEGGVVQFEMQSAAVNGAPHAYVSGHGYVRIADGGAVSSAIG